jgi:thiol-disulfide isomerase/thioredoxin
MTVLTSRETMRNPLLPVALAIALLPIWPAMAADASRPTRTATRSGPVEVDRPSPTFAGWTTHGTMLSLAMLLEPSRDQPRARALVVTFFATWCQPCKEKLPELLRVAGAFEAQDVRVVLVAFGQNTEEVKPYLEARGIPASVPVIVDPFMKIAGRLGVDKTLPRTFVLDGGGVVRTIFEFEGDDFEAQLREAIAAAVGRSSLPASDGHPGAGGAPSSGDGGRSASPIQPR